ncbi:hypothetical protein VMCG_08764 [Cytospora schulzeri]|uniref:Glucose-methanol-choline oxidoreductase N-terminal domain-containing protein n=1 Tax=Cytospora schulzeri TaxID=448051 RepID=A0A423VRZ1_9PEZI|nr:hypothetical protein VMCG_08764 [Valsa malicola]
MTAETNDFDIVIVGGGTAGLSLSSRPDRIYRSYPRVPEQLVQAVLTPAANSQLYKTPVDWDLKTVPQHTDAWAGKQENLGGREIGFTQGKMLGGSSGLNGLSFTASAKTVVDGWAELGNPGWEWPAFSQSLNRS